MSRIFGLVPAAGRSRRMRSPKLLLPVNGRKVIDHLLDSIRPDVEELLVLIRADDSVLASALAQRSDVRIVQAISDPPDMRHSIELLLAEVHRAFSPAAGDGWLLTPADHPVVCPEVVRLVVQVFREAPDAIHIPSFNGRGGHPSIFPWALAARVAELAADQGLNSLRQLPGVQTIMHPTEEPSVLWDLDTPEDYARLVSAMEQRSP